MATSVHQVSWDVVEVVKGGDTYFQVTEVAQHHLFPSGIKAEDNLISFNILRWQQTVRDTTT